MRKKGFVSLIFLASVVSIIALIVFFLLTQESIAPRTIAEKPPIVDHFACADYCPGASGKYMVKIYEGITDPNECRALGGIPQTYSGWGETNICKVE